MCFKGLEEHLEKTRKIFPRFYFISNDDLVELLSFGKDRKRIIDIMESFFAVVNQVSFDTNNQNKIIELS